jgi:type IV secretory pathway VirB2 component (pilin)
MGVTMKMNKVLASVAAAALVTGTSAQAAASAPVRAPAEVEGEGLFGGSFLIPAIIVIAIGLGLYFALEEDDEPASP